MQGVVGVFVPGPVWEVAIVSAFVAEGLFEGPDEVAVPC